MRGARWRRPWGERAAMHAARRMHIHGCEATLIQIPEPPAPAMPPAPTERHVYLKKRRRQASIWHCRHDKVISSPSL